MSSPIESTTWTAQGWRAANNAPAHPGWHLPGVFNVHSHAFQRAMAGLTERRGPTADSFWTWRERMYALAEKFDPDSLRDVAAQLYVEMLEAGYTAVCEFQYLHHAADGQRYADPAQMSLALVEAAAEAGIQLLLLPTLYMVGGFDQRPLAPRQRRFRHGIDDYLALLQRLDALRGPMLEVGTCFHSLRAVPADAMRAVLDARRPRRQPIHIHIAEQQVEVDECLQQRGARPVAWLLDNCPVDAQWSLVHATHVDGDEVGRLAASGACAALCPTTEANLGDGLFPLARYLDAGGCVAIGSDSHASVSVCEELRWLEYGQRLVGGERNVAARSAGASSGEALFDAVLAGGQRSCGGNFDSGWLSLDGDAIELACRDGRYVLDSWLFGSSRPLIDRVEINGLERVSGGRHRNRDAIEARYRRSLRRLLTGL